jgi:hypothetical protein
MPVPIAASRFEIIKIIVETIANNSNNNEQNGTGADLMQSTYASLSFQLLDLSLRIIAC